MAKNVINCSGSGLFGGVKKNESDGWYVKIIRKVDITEEIML